ncbi:hypothetical protein ACVWY3_001811 [Bradyrhizobium sp. USDA 4486]
MGDELPAVGADFAVGAAAAGLGLSFVGPVLTVLPASLVGFFDASLAGVFAAPLLAPLAASFEMSFELSLPVPLSVPLSVPLAGAFGVFLAVSLAAGFALSLVPSALVSLDLARAAQPTESPAVRHRTRPMDRHMARGKEITAFRRPESVSWLKI